MMRFGVLFVGTAMALAASAARASEGQVTVRVGEQDSCQVTGVTTYTPDRARNATACTIRFDLAKLPKDAKVLSASLRFWARPAGAFAARRWNEKDFDGFKCWQVGGGEAPLDVSYPFESAHFGLHVWDVTKAVRAWVADAAANKGLRLNCPLASNDAQPAWRRPYLQITTAGDAPNRPKPPTDLKAFYRAGQVFLTWKNPPSDGAFFDATSRLYAHSEPITADNLDAAMLLGEVHRNSQLNYRRSCYTWDGLGAYGCFGVAREYLWDKLPKDAKGKPKGTFADLQKTFQKRYNFVIDDAWPAKVKGGACLTDGTAAGEGRFILAGPELSDDTGLFVWTVPKAGKYHFAVTGVAAGWENRLDVAGANTAGPVAAKVAPPRPVLQFVLHANGKGYRNEQYRQYVYWGGGADGLHTDPSTPFMLQVQVAPQYLWKIPAHWAKPITQYGGSGATILGDPLYAPPTARAPFPSIRVSLNRDWGHWVPAWRFYHGGRTAPASVKDFDAAFIIDDQLPVTAGPLANFYGYHDRLNSGADPRRATARAYVENRVIRELDMYFGLFPKADRRLTRAAWQRPLMTLAMHRGDRLATVSSAMDTPWTSKRAAGMWRFIGRKDWPVKTPEGFSPWDWNDPVWFARQFPARDWAWITTCQSPNYDRGDDLYNWQDMGYPRFYKDLASARRAGWWWWCWIGDAPDGGGGFAPLDEAVPAFSNATCSFEPLPHWPTEPAGTLTGYVGWHNAHMPFTRLPEERHLKGLKPPPGKPHPYFVGSKIVWTPVALDLIDTPERFEIALRIRDRGLTLNGNSVPKCPADFGMTDVTLRRLKRFKVAQGTQYAWKNVQVATGRVLQSGVAAADAHGLLTVPQVAVDRTVLGNKLIVTAAGKPADADTAGKVQLTLYRGRNTPEAKELTYAEYVQRCKDPEMVKRVRAGRTFAISDFMTGSATGEFWSHWGAGFRDAFEFPADGRYRVEAKFRRALKYNGAWPVMSCSAANAGPGMIALDSAGPATFVWWIDAKAGERKLIEFRMRNHTMNSVNEHYQTIDGKRTTRGFAVDGVTFVQLGVRPAEVEKVWRVRIKTRSLRAGVGAPVRVVAEAQDAWGEVLPKALTFSATGGATVSAAGVFTAAKAGAYAVTATCGQAGDTVPVVVAGDAWIEDFDDEWADGWRETVFGGKEAPNWTCTRQKTLGRMHQYGRDAQTALTFDGGSVWTDISAVADRVPSGQYFRLGSAQGVVFRWADKDNHYRFEKRAVAGTRDNPKPKPIFRLVKVVAGKQTVLAEEAKDVAPTVLTGQAARAYRSFRYWKDKYLSRVETFAFDRFAVTVRGARIVCSLNGQEVVSADDGALKTGTVGVYCEGPAVFDNITVKPLK